MTVTPAPRSLPPIVKRDLRVLLIAKHVHWEDGLHPEDGSHALYHREMRQAMQRIGVNLRLADSYTALFGPVEADFVFPLLNRGGFLNSEMLLPLLCERQGIPYLGASPIVRGLADDKHLAKQAAVQAGVPTAPWALFRRGAAIDTTRIPCAASHVVKPNASSASWGISRAHSREAVQAAVLALHREGHDAIVEPFVPGHDVAVSAITLDGAPFLLPTHIIEQDDPHDLRTYAEKRDLGGGGQAYAIRPLADARLLDEAERQTRLLIPDYLPFDYGRFEFRLDAATGELRFMEVNLNCNLWSRKTIAMAAARIGWSHDALIETILTESLRRHGLMAGAYPLAA